MAKTFDEFLDGEYAEPKTIDSTIKQMAGTVARNLTTIGSVVIWRSRKWVLSSGWVHYLPVQAL